MAEYRVIWEIDIEADDLVSAAREARSHQLDPEATVGVFDVTDKGGRTGRVDLDEAQVTVVESRRPDPAAALASHRAALVHIRDAMVVDGSCRRCRWKRGSHNPESICGIAAAALARVTPARQAGSVVDGKVLCPHGHAGPHRYVETIQNWRPVGELSGPVLAVSSGYESGEGYDDGEDGHLECHAETGAGGMCLVVFDLPDGIEIDWV